VALRACELEGEQRVVASMRDITVRKHEQESLRMNEERLRLSMEASRQGWFELNVQTGETISSPEYIDMLGYEVEEFRSSFQSWLERIHPADRAQVTEIYNRALRGDGLAALEYRQQTKTGGWKWLRSVAKVVQRDASGRPLRVMGTHTDITDRKELEGQLLHSQRLEAVGTLASGVAHDLNNILTPMLMASGLLREKLADPTDRELMARLDDGGRRGAAIVRQLLDFSRNLAQDRVPLNPRPMLQEMAQLMRATFPKEILIAEAIAPGSDLVEVEPNQLHQVLMNLCVNARDAMTVGGTITLGLGRTEVPAVAGARGGPHLVLSVADTGSGIPPENLGRIFDPFFTTKPLGKGTGLGLASVHGIVKAHHGFVRVESQMGRGTTFRVFLPVKAGTAEAPVPVAPPAAAPATAPKGAGIMVVDDDPAVLLVTGRMLERIGHQVVRAASAAEALEALPKNPQVVLVVTDFSMPGMDGPTLAPLLRQISPGLKIIGVSGLKQDYRAAELAAVGFSEVLSKPYEWDELVRAVQRHLPPAARPA
jgi:PAS domain S-box-containing protein